jgi:serine/threonine-protein kinase HipA
MKTQGRGKLLEVRWAQDGRRVGRLLHNGPIYFSYDPEWLRTGHNLSPLMLPFDSRPQNILAEGCLGLPGFIADALPDSWGTKVAEAVFARHGWGSVTAMKLLAWLGDRAMGALSFQPAITGPEEAENWLGRIAVERLAHEARDLLRGQADEIATMAVAGGSAGGAHPKALVIEHADGTLSLRRTPEAIGEKPALLKLDLSEAQPSCRVEFAYHLMARAAGIEMPASRLVKSGRVAHVLIHRFDWREGRRLHLHSLSGLCHRPKSGLDYADLFRAIARLGLPREQLLQAARRMVFNLLSANLDDHGKNHAFLYDATLARWELSPAYDLTYAPGVLSRGMTIAGEVFPSLATVRDFLSSVAITPAESQGLMKAVASALARWTEFAQTAGIAGAKAEEIAAEHRKLRERVA